MCLFKSLQGSIGGGIDLKKHLKFQNLNLVLVSVNGSPDKTPGSRGDYTSAPGETWEIKAECAGKIHLLAHKHTLNPFLSRRGGLSKVEALKHSDSVIQEIRMPKTKLHWTEKLLRLWCEHAVQVQLPVSFVEIGFIRIVLEVYGVANATVSNMKQRWLSLMVWFK